MADLNDLQRWLKSRPDEIAKEAAMDLMRAGLMLETQIKANASGRPGPRAVTGDYRGSWTTRPVPGKPEVSVSTNRPQGPRLEFGFVGADSLGRVYNQPPYPHVGPAIRSKERQIQQIIEEGIEIVMGKGL